MKPEFKGELEMKNIALDLMMGLLCMVLTITIIGIAFVPDVLEAWEDMRE